MVLWFYGLLLLQKKELRHPKGQATPSSSLSSMGALQELVADLRRALRTESNVRLAVVYGSIARGDEDAGSDLDLLVSLAEDRPLAAVKLAVLLERTLGRDVDVARLNRVKDSAPLLLLQTLDEGRVVLDRDHQWEQLRAQRPDIARRARRSHAARLRRARASIDELVGGGE
jgi:predicted nucleotidyltransferase